MTIMEIMKVTEEGVLEKAAKIIRAGGIVVYPTDTAYGLGVNALDEKALEKFYTLKGRESTKPTHIVVADVAMAVRYADATDTARHLMNTLLPGPLTVILKKRDRVPSILVGGGETVGVRIPDNTIALTLSKITDVPITTPSANVHGGDTPYSIDAVVHSFGEKVDDIDLVIDGGVLSQVAPSTLVDLTVEPFKILREGPITREQIQEVVG